MFIVFNKQKIYSYLVALSTVIILFVIAFVATNDTQNIIQTSTNTEVNEQIVNLQTDMKEANIQNENISNK